MLLTDAANRAHTILHDDFGRIVLEISPDEGRFKYSYNDTTGAFEKQQTGLDGQSHVTEKLEFASSGRLVKRMIAGCTETLSYDGDLLERLDGCGNSHTYLRDAFGQIVQHTQTIQPDNKQVAAFNFITSYTYDSITGQLVERRLPDGQYLSYRYDKTDGKQNAITRDRGWFAWIGEHIHDRFVAGLRAILPDNITQEPILTDISWRPFGGIENHTASNGIIKQSTFDKAGRLTAIDIGSKTNPGAIEALRYQHDGANNIISSKRNMEQRSYLYDAVHRLTDERIDAITGANPTQQVVAASTSSTTAITAPSVTSSAANDVSYRYDPLGQRRSQTEQVQRDSYGRQSVRRNQQFIYDDAHRLIEVREASKTVARYRYDALGNRVVKTINGRTTYFVYDTAHKLIAEANAEGQLTTQYLYADYRPYAVMRAQDKGQTRTLYAIHTDDRGLPLAVTDKNQQVVWRGDFDAFGNQRALTMQQAAANDSAFTMMTAAQAADSSEPDHFEMNLRIAGQYADQETGLFYNIHRYYDPSRGRYITPDPLGLTSGVESYAYVGSNPMGEIDPLGLFKVPSRVVVTGNLDPVFSDKGHGDIIRIAFAQYEAEHHGEARFSQTVIDQIIRNAYQTDALPDVGNPTVFPYSVGTTGVAGGGQYNPQNHFDNPNDGPEFKSVTDHTKIGSYKGANGNWIDNTLDTINKKRVLYGAAGTGISGALSNFGQNAHTLADFYSHSNWVDATTRGGAVDNVYTEGGVTKHECGAVPNGLGMTRIWDGRNDAIKFDSLYTGTVLGGKTEDEKTNKICGKNYLGDLECDNDRTTHGYWNKDNDTSAAGGQKYTTEQTKSFVKSKIFYWQAEKYDPANPPSGVLGVGWFADDKKSLSDLKKGERIYVPQDIVNYHQMAFSLAVQDVKREIANLYAYTEGKTVGSYTVHDAFKMDKGALDYTGIDYKTMSDKRAP
ncbi:RHS repeat-associated protein [Undibacterium sp. GrIS 1.8]|uniref:RHS repeat domain-containing protein n=1 Tax=Undibacterium sp. GrIS 1.8 TaxID=3143934 RepID=UPI003394CB5A